MEGAAFHAHGSQHGKFAPPQTDAGGNRIKHVGDGNQGNQHDKAEGEDVNHQKDIAVSLHALSYIIDAVFLYGDARLFYDSLHLCDGLCGILH
jgi:hypothetical protein